MKLGDQMNMKLVNCFLGIFICGCSIALSACQMNSSPVFLDVNTPLPGWKEIIPGETSLDNAIKIINNLPNLDTNSSEPKPFQQRGFDVIVWKLKNDTKISIRSEDNIVQTISFSPWSISYWYYSFNPNSISLETAIKRLGAPDLVINTGRSLTSWYDQFLINPEIGFAISYPPEYSRNKRWSEEIHPKGKILSITYFNPKIFDELIERGIFHAGITSTPEETWERMQPWKGYGVIPELYPTDKD